MFIYLKMMKMAGYDFWLICMTLMAFIGGERILFVSSALSER